MSNSRHSSLLRIWNWFWHLFFIVFNIIFRWILWRPWLLLSRLCWLFSIWRSRWRFVGFFFRIGFYNHIKLLFRNCYTFLWIRWIIFNHLSNIYKHFICWLFQWFCFRWHISFFCSFYTYIFRFLAFWLTWMITF